MKTEPQTTLFPYTTLFRSKNKRRHETMKKLQSTKNKRRHETMKKLQAVLLAVCLVLALVPFSAVAQDVVFTDRSEEHTSELQSRFDVVCRLLIEHKNITHI